MLADERILKTCLFFTSNRLSNILRKIVNETFSEIGLTAPQIYLMIIVNQFPEITITELSEKLDIAPSTCTRFVDSLVKQKILQKKQDWKLVHVSLTEFGREKAEKIDACMKNFREKCKKAIDDEEYKNLAAEICSVADRLSKI